MTNGQAYDGQAVYRIRVQGPLDRRWSDWFDGFTIVPQAGDVTQLAGPVTDQAALHGLRSKIRDLGLPLLAGHRVEHDDGKAP